MNETIEVYIIGIVIALIVSPAPFVAAALFRYLLTLRNEAYSRLSDSQERLFNDLALIAVNAAKQARENKLISDTAEAAKDYAVKSLQNMLRNRGLDYFADKLTEVSDRIEDAYVKALKDAYIEIWVDDDTESVGPG